MLEIDPQDIDNYIGYESKPSDWFEISQERINAFADCTMDHQYIHVDPERAKDSQFGTTIAHGLLTLSVLPHFHDKHFAVFIKGYHTGINYGFDKIRFISPVKSGARIRTRTKLTSIKEVKPGQFNLTTEVTVEIEGEQKPALIAEWLTVQLVS